MRDSCKLCRRKGVDLQKSHLFPAAIYRVMRGDPSNGNPNPYLITPNGVVQTSRQDWAHLLCFDCEQMFSKNGEHWLFNNGLKADGSFKLASILASKTPSVPDPKSTSTKLYYAAGIPEINIAALTYFAVSMFWRASIYPWTSDKRIPVKLGTYGEAFRQYLLGLASFPKSAALCVVVREKSEIDRLTHEPISEKINTVYTHRFSMPGFHFQLFVGKNIPDVYRRYCFVTGERNPLIVSGIVEPRLLKEAVQAVSHTNILRNG